jgi:hypothetical protein
MSRSRIPFATIRSLAVGLLFTRERAQRAGVRLFSGCLYGRDRPGPTAGEHPHHKSDAGGSAFRGSGYLNSFIYGPTVVYGTGWYYDPWWGGFYYPRPWTWGFSMWYDPWYGWTFGYDFGLDWFNFGLGRDFWFGRWWGPWIYRPPYVWHHFRGHGLYEHDVRRIRMADHQVNLYASRQDIM